jgi:hypothetical protein
VTAAAVNGGPAVVDRRRVSLIDPGIPSQPYHHETLALPDDESERLLRKVRKSIAACAERAFDRLSADLEPSYHVSSVTIRQPPLDALPTTVEEVHRSYYTTCRADGMLYHSAICAAARQRDWTIASHRRGEELGKAAEALGASRPEVERFLDDLKHTLKSPWTAEHRLALAAAIAELNTRSKLRIPRP